MSKKSVHRSLQMTDRQKKAVETAALIALQAVYQAAMRQVITGLGYADRPIQLGDSSILDKLAARASVTAASVQDTYNTMLGTQIEGLAKDLSDAQMRKALTTFETRVTHYNETTLVPFAGNWAAQEAVLDFYNNNITADHAASLADIVQWTWVQNTDEQDECTDAEAASPDTVDALVSIAGGSPPVHPNCLVAGTLVAGPLAHAAFERPYQGPVVTIRTARGNVLTGTPNHPVLTREGWVALGALKEGQRVISCLYLEEMPRLLVDPDKQQIPTVIEQILRTSAVPLLKVPVASTDFHGDGLAESEVHIVLADRCLQSDVDASPLGDVFKPTGQTPLRGAGIAPAALTAQRALHSVAVRVAPTSNGIMGSPSERGSLLGGHATRAGDPRRLVVPGDQAALQEPRTEASPADACLLAQRLLRFSGLIAEDQVIEISDSNAECHVYNLSTAEGWYAANCIIVSNCECDLIPGEFDPADPSILPAEEDLWTGEVSLDGMYDRGEPVGAMTSGVGVGTGIELPPVPTPEPGTSFTALPDSIPVPFPDDALRGQVVEDAANYAISQAAEILGKSEEDIVREMEDWRVMGDLVRSLSDAARDALVQVDSSLEPAAIDRLINEWSRSSTRGGSAMLQDAAADLLGSGLTAVVQKGIDDAAEALDFGWLAQAREIAPELIRAQYELTQRWLEEQGITTVRLYRGMRGLPEGVDPSLASELTRGASREIDAGQSPLSSWSTSPNEAKNFAGPVGYVLSADVPVARIFSSGLRGFGTFSEYEWVVFGGVQRVRITSVV